MKGLRNVLLSFLVLVVAGYVQASIINVPTAIHPTIQAGINAASNGDTVLVANGTYTGPGNVNLNFNPNPAFPVKNITVKSANGPANCIIDCENVAGARGFYFSRGESSASVVDGFTIRNGWSGTYGAGGGIYCKDGSSPTITNNIIIGNKAEWGGGICCMINSHPVIANNTITGNWNDLFYGGTARKTTEKHLG